MRAPLLFSLVAITALLAGCGSDASSPVAPVTPFDYDATVPLDAKVGKRANTEFDYPIAAYELSYRAGGNIVQAYLVAPAEIRGGPLPAAVYLHGSGADRTQLVAPATWLAARGAIAVVLTAPSARLPSPENQSDPAQALQQVRRLELADVIAVRRAIDFLQTRDDVDPERIGFVGWSAGARVGALVASVETRLDAVVLMSLGSGTVAQFVEAAPPNLQADVRRVFTTIDPLAAIGKVDPSRLLLQQGENDELVPKTALRAIAAAAQKGADIRWYDTPHSLDATAYEEHLVWLSEKLSVTGPAVPGAATGPGGADPALSGGS